MRYDWPDYFMQQHPDGFDNVESVSWGAPPRRLGAWQRIRERVRDALYWLADHC